ncbi:hypothetical protein G7046_g3020 [Stylonectria norvegica]|nr:hypothetical protein G7046_g3020 [Stylonectria norvegica]
MPSEHIHIGVFIPSGAQVLDVATVDILGVMSKEYLDALEFLPAHVKALAPHVKISYISSLEQGMDIPLTSNMTIKATHLYTDAEVAPGKIDILVVPGPDPRSTFEEAGLKWLRRHFETEGVDVLSVCTGIYICGAAGILKGKSASGPRGLQDDLKKKDWGVKLVGDEYRWVRDGNLWSSGGVTNGNDLMAAYARSGKHWAKPLAETGLMLTDVGDRGQVYRESATMFTVGAAWLMLKAWFAGGSKGTKSGLTVCGWSSGFG